MFPRCSLLGPSYQASLQSVGGRRADARTGTGTLAYFFTTDDLRKRCFSAGFECTEVKYSCVKLVNKRNKKEMKRVFVTGTFVKPPLAGSDCIGYKSTTSNALCTS